MNPSTFLFLFLIFDVDTSGKIRQLCWNERLYISKIVKFESDLLKTNENIASSSFTEVYMVWGGTRQTSVNFHNFAELYLHSLTTYHLKT